MIAPNDTAFSIRAVERRDIPAMHALMCDLADNENERHFLTVTPERLEQTGFGDHPLWQGFVADHDGTLVGYTTYIQDFHIWSGSPRFSLDDIYVHPAFRSHGLGEQLMRRVFEQAKSVNAYVSWTVQQENQRAIAFYQRLGAEYRVIGKCGWRA